MLCVCFLSFVYSDKVHPQLYVQREYRSVQAYATHAFLKRVHSNLSGRLIIIPFGKGTVSII